MECFIFDWASFANTVLGALLGGVLSAIISYFFFLKGKGLQFLTSWMANNLGDILIRQTYPQFFNGGISCSPPPPNSNDLDIPHLDKVMVNQIKNLVENKLEILFRVSDSDWNFPMAAGVLVRDSNKIAHAAKNSMFGYMQVEIALSTAQEPGGYEIFFEMHDVQKNGKSPKTNNQSIKISLK